MKLDTGANRKWSMRLAEPPQDPLYSRSTRALIYLGCALFCAAVWAGLYVAGAWIIDAVPALLGR